MSINPLKIKLCSWILKTLLAYTPTAYIEKELKHHIRNITNDRKDKI